MATLAEPSIQLGAGLLKAVRGLANGEPVEKEKGERGEPRTGMAHSGQRRRWLCGVSALSF